jgi:hypothetical protein
VRRRAKEELLDPNLFSRFLHLVYRSLCRVDQHLHPAVVQALNGHDIDGRTVSAKMDEYA